MLWKNRDRICDINKRKKIVLIYILIISHTYIHTFIFTYKKKRHIVASWQLQTIEKTLKNTCKGLVSTWFNREKSLFLKVLCTFTQVFLELESRSRRYFGVFYRIKQHRLRKANFRSKTFSAIDPCHYICTEWRSGERRFWAN